MYATYNIYNNEPTLRRSLESILPYVEKVIAVDGAYSNFPHENPQSTDATKETFHEFCGDKLIWVDCEGKPWPTQIGKRNEYVKRVPDGEWFLVMDGDKIIKGRIREGFNFAEASSYICIGMKSVNHVPIWNGPYADSGRHKYAIIPRDAWENVKWRKNYGMGGWLYRKVEGMIYRRHHSAVHVGNKRVIRPEIALWGVSLVNLNYEMGWERWQANLEYKTKNPIH